MREISLTYFTDPVFEAQRTSVADNEQKYNLYSQLLAELLAQSGPS